MNRWTGTGHLTKDPKFLETESGTAICTLRIAVKRAGKQGQDGYFDVKCFDAQASACAQYLKAGREVAIDGRLLFDEFQTQDGAYASRVYVIAERVEFLASRKPFQRSGQLRGVARTARHGRRGAGARPGRLTTIAGPRRSTGRGPDDFHRERRHDHHNHHPPRDRTRFLACSPAERARDELLELRYRLGDGQRMGQLFERADPAARGWRPGRSRSAGAPTSTSAAPRARAATAAARGRARVRAVGRLRRRARGRRAAGRSSRSRRS